MYEKHSIQALSHCIAVGHEVVNLASKIPQTVKGKVGRGPGRQVNGEATVFSLNLCNGHEMS